MMHSCSEKRMMMWSLSLVSILVFGSHANHLCRPDQKNALWEFKSEFYVQRLDLWKSDAKTVKWRNNTDCCFWDGISCDPKTGKVVKLNLQGSYLNGPLRSNSSLFRLQYLQNLDLKDNNISGVLPDSIDNLKHLRVLSLSSCSLFGKISSSLGNLSYLTDLHLYDNGFIGELPNSMGNLNRLTDLRLHINKLSGNFPPMLFNLSELTAIYLGSNQFDGMLPSNMSSLSKLESFDISENSFSGSIPSSLFVIPSLLLLDLSRNDFSSPLNIGNISSPSKLRGKNLNGPIPRFISKLVRLMFLDLSFWNTRRSMVDFSIFLHLKSLEFLYLSYLNTRSMVDLSLFSSLVSLADLDLSGNNVKISSTLHLPSPIKFLALSSCNISEFPKFLQSQTRLDHIDISANQIEGQVPKWLWRLPMLRSVNISHNSFSGFQGSAVVIQSSEKLSVLDISANSFLDLPLLPKSLVHFLGSGNQFSGEIPREICELVSLKGLVLSNNNFSGSIPPCFENFNTNISVLHLQNNNLSGGFPEESIGDQLRSLDIGHNLLSGELPKSLINCTYLEFLNVEDNLFSDTFPFWLRLLPDLQILVLRSNKFYGPISLHGVSLSFPKLRIFDISENRFTGVLPSDYFVGWTALSSVIDNGRISYTYSVHHKSVALVIKGLKMELVGSVFTMYKTIDVSGNRFQGDISESIGLLKELIVLNMSNNDFTGRIPPSLGNLSNIQSLDLSQNKLSGEIPPELGRLTFLARMNFSYNMLEGPIPQGTQIQSQNSSSFAENPGLCGAPLIENCGRGGREEEATKQEHEHERKEEKEKDQVLSWIAAAIAYVPGLFCGLVIGHILTSYRHYWFMKIFHCFG